MRAGPGTRFERVKPIRFWGLTAAAALAFAATFALGLWQLDRAQQKIALQTAIEEQKVLPALDQRALLATKNIADLLHRRVVLRGSWVAEHTVFLDNRQLKGRPGFYVVTPLRLEGSRAAVLVQRGWAARNFLDRDQLPPVATPPGPVEVQGRIAPAPAKLYEFANTPAGRIRQNLDVVAFEAETRLAFAPGSVQETGAASQGLQRDWPQATTGVEKHYGYAFQWWALSVLIALLYAWFQIILPRRKRRPHA